VASYAALGLAGRLTAAQGHIRIAWLTGGACAMGVGMWFMHYIGLLAFSLPVTIWYDWHTVALSLLCAVLASAVALFVVSRRQMKLRHALLGRGIAAMHCIRNGSHAAACHVHLFSRPGGGVGCPCRRNFAGCVVVFVYSSRCRP
jgi:NO-binding membrane sensor protein with MHYT domain